VAERTITPQWRRQGEGTKYPFADGAPLANDEGLVVLEGTFLDAALYPVGAGAGLYLARVDVDHQEVTLWVGSPADPELASGTVPLVAPPDEVALADAHGRPAGVLVSESARLGVFQSWGVGSHAFDPDQTPFAATACFPTPEAGVRGFLLEDGSLLVGDVWLVGDDGVVLRDETLTVPAACGRPAAAVQAVRVDVVGDPLFRRRLCRPNDLFATPRFVKALRVVGPNRTFTCAPDEFGNIQVAAGNDLAADTVLRIAATPDGMRVSAVGATTDNAAK
jgi:hypothetical protein